MARNSYHVRSLRRRVAESLTVPEAEKASYFGYTRYLQWRGAFERTHRRRAPSWDRYLAWGIGAETVDEFVQATKTHAFIWQRLDEDCAMESR